jgi:hypothetical protein
MGWWTTEEKYISDIIKNIGISESITGRNWCQFDFRGAGRNWYQFDFRRKKFNPLHSVALQSARSGRNWYQFDFRRKKFNPLHSVALQSARSGAIESPVDLGQGFGFCAGVLSTSGLAESGRSEIGAVRLIGGTPNKISPLIHPGGDSRPSSSLWFWPTL